MRSAWTVAAIAFAIAVGLAGCEAPSPGDLPDDHDRPAADDDIVGWTPGVPATRGAPDAQAPARLPTPPSPPPPAREAGPPPITCALTISPKTLRRGQSATFVLNVSVNEVQAFWHGPDVTTRHPVPGWLASARTWSATYTYDKPGTWTRSASFENPRGEVVCLTSSEVLTVTD